MKKCSTCEYAIFDELWGEFKCKKLGIRIYATRVTCNKYKKKEQKKDGKGICTGVG